MIYMRNALTIDLEEFFQIQVLSRVISDKDWESFPSDVEKNTRIVLDLLQEENIKATFFCLGWVSMRHRELIKEISSYGHEIACHGLMHKPITELSPKVFREYTYQAKDMLEDITGTKVSGYRAPTYSITTKTLWALEVLEELGFDYDSSIFPIYHDNYGIPSAPRFPYRIESMKLVEFPISTVKVFGYNLPVSGGGYFRILPYFITNLGLGTINREGKPFIFYIHPWEFMPDTPRIPGLSTLSRFRTYTGLSRTLFKFRRLLKEFRFTTARDVLSDEGLI